MKMQLKDSVNSTAGSLPAENSPRECGGTLAQFLVVVAFLVPVAASIGWAASEGFRCIQTSRENLRANEIVMQRAESLRLFTWSQVCDTNSQRKPVFVERAEHPDLIFNSGGVQYAGYLSPGPSPAGTPSKACGPHMRSVTLTLCWTNYIGGKPIVHTREIQTRLARNGAPKYIWGTF